MRRFTKIVSVDLISLSGIKVKDAEKIDGALHALHFGGNK